MYREASANVFENTPLCQQWLRHFGYDASDRLTLEKRLSACLAQAGNANSTYSTWTFDAAGQVTNVATKKSNDTLILSMAYTRDNVGNPTQITDQLLLPDNQTWEAGSWTFGYDNTNRLTLEKRTGAHPYWYEYALDGAGNRTQFVQKDGDGNVVGTTNATYSADNRLLTYGNTSYTWDQNGNQLTKTTNQVTVTMGWDYDNKLVLLTDGATLSFTYNGGGLRQSKTADGTTTRFLYDGVRLLAETDANGTITRSYTLAPIGGEWYPLVSDRSGAASRWYAFDALGTTRALTDHSQLTTHQFTDDAWGNVLAASDPAATPHQYIGRYGYYANGTSGLMLLTQRYYDGGVGRFASEDPSRDRLDWYAYGQWSPSIEIDPSGTTAQCLRVFCGPDLTGMFVRDLNDLKKGVYMLTALGGGGVIWDSIMYMIGSHLDWPGIKYPPLSAPSLPQEPQCGYLACNATNGLCGKCVEEMTFGNIAFGFLSGFLLHLSEDATTEFGKWLKEHIYNTPWTDQHEGGYDAGNHLGRANWEPWDHVSADELCGEVAQQRGITHHANCRPCPIPFGPDRWPPSRHWMTGGSINW